MEFSAVDKLKLWLAGGLSVATFYAGFYHFERESFAVRAAVLAGGFAVALLVGYFSEPGRQFVAFSKGASEEMRKMVWPGRKETFQMTGIVLAFTALVAVFLWLIDALLVWAYQAITF